VAAERAPRPDSAAAPSNRLRRDYPESNTNREGSRMSRTSPDHPITDPPLAAPPLADGRLADGSDPPQAQRTAGSAEQVGLCLGRTCLAWQADGELQPNDLRLVLERLCRVDAQACQALAEVR